jgi:hypothetical protein
MASVVPSIEGWNAKPADGLGDVIAAAKSRLCITVHLLGETSAATTPRNPLDPEAT